MSILRLLGKFFFILSIMLVATGIIGFATWTLTRNEWGTALIMADFYLTLGNSFIQSLIKEWIIDEEENNNWMMRLPPLPDPESNAFKSILKALALVMVESSLIIAVFQLNPVWGYFVFILVSHLRGLEKAVKGR